MYIWWIGKFAPSNHINGWQPYSVRTLYGSIMYVLWDRKKGSLKLYYALQPYPIRTLYGSIMYVLWDQNKCTLKLYYVWQLYNVRTLCSTNYSVYMVNWKVCTIKLYSQLAAVYRTYAVWYYCVCMVKLESLHHQIIFTAGSCIPYVRCTVVLCMYCEIEIYAFWNFTTAGSRITYVRCMVLQCILVI